MYVPNPIDTSDIKLPQELEDLIEKLAENAHDVWAKQRISDGWTYGPERDDINKKHPDLIPYSDLSEFEKKYDRLMAVETLKIISKMGYIIRTINP